MSTMIRAELSNKSKWHISKERYYELKHFCLQYPEWKRKLIDIQYTAISRQLSIDKMFTNPTEQRAIEREVYISNMSKVEQACKEADEELADYILLSLAWGKTFTYLQTIKSIPCCKDVFYDRYRKAFWVLDKIR